LAHLQLQHRVPRVGQRGEIYVRPRWRLHNGDATIHTDLVLLRELHGPGIECLRIHLPAYPSRVLASLEVPERHHREQHHAPHEGDRYPHLLRLVGWFPPYSRHRLETGVNFRQHPELSAVRVAWPGATTRSPTAPSR